jgi:effector-binding domain-containing protein
MDYGVELQKLPAVKVLSLRGIIPRHRDEVMLWERLYQFIDENKIPHHSGEYSTCFDAEYKETDPDVEIAVPVDILGESHGDFIYKEYEEIPLAATIRFSGLYDSGYGAAAEKLALWMETNGYAFAGYMRDHLITSPEDHADPAKRITELQVPIAKEK